MILSQSYDEYMKNIAPAPTLLPIRLKVIFPQHWQLNLENVQVEQFDNANDLIKHIQKLCENRGDPVSFKGNVQLRISGPLAIVGMEQSNV